jgi:SAM-dependent methyltransferase
MTDGAENDWLGRSAAEGELSRMIHNPNTRETLAILLNDYEMFGLRWTLRNALVYLLKRPRDDFDRKYGVSTSGNVEPSDTEIPNVTALDNAITYEPTQEAVMRHILRYVATHFNPAALTFVDLGCGKGRALLMAAELPFIEVVGVEISASHCRMAERNAAAAGAPATLKRVRARLPKRTNIVVRQADATQFEFPRTDLLVYLFNPFRGPVFRSVLDRLAAFQASTQRSVHVILCSPRCEGLLESHPAFDKQYEFQVIATGYSWNLWRCRGELARANAKVRATPERSSDARHDAS